MAEKIKLALICGGISSEREISLLTGKQIYDNLNKEKYDIILIDSAKIPGGKKENQATTDVKVDAVDKGKREFSPEKMGSLADVAGCDVAFIALHGKFGEDGTIQGFLELMGVPYTGSKVLASAIAMDKAMTKKVLSASGLTVAPSVNFEAHGGKWDKAGVRSEVNAMGYPVMVKPSRQGSSVGMVKVDSDAELVPAIENALRYDEFMVIEKFVDGMEMSISVLGGNEPFALPIAEIVPASGEYDFYSKYTPGATEEIVPARLSDEDTSKAQADAVAAYKALGCSGAARVDIIFDGKDMYILELNTIPGMTATSLLPRCAKEYGIEFRELLDIIIESSME